MNTNLPLPSTSNPLPPVIVTDWRRFSCGLWRIPRGDIDAAYSADTFPRVKTFRHAGRLFTNTGCHFGGPVLATVDCYPLWSADGFTASEPDRDGYEGCEAIHAGERILLGPKVVFTASDPTTAEWRTLLRVLYADGGHFAHGCIYREFLKRRFRPDSENGREAYSQELAECDARAMPQTREEMCCLLDGAGDGSPSAAMPQQIEFAL